MAREQRNDVDYFPHECMHGRKMHIIENKYGNDGYATWFKLLEQLGKANFHYIDISEDMNLMFLSSIFKIDEETTLNILEDLSKVGAINKNLYDNYKVIYSEKFVESVRDAYRKRISEPLEHSALLELIINKNNKSTAETPQTSGIKAEVIPKEEKRREKKRREEKKAGEKPPSPSLAFDLLKLEKPDALNIFEMQHKKQVKDWDKLIKSFNNKIELELAQNKINFESEELFPRFKGFTDNWISNELKYDKTPEKNSYESGKLGRF